jgi:hypothetical protein
MWRLPERRQAIPRQFDRCFGSHLFVLVGFAGAKTSVLRYFLSSVLCSLSSALCLPGRSF